MRSYKTTLKKKIMEEKTTPTEGKKLSYEELSKAASDLHVQYQKLMIEYRKVREALDRREFEATSFFVQMLFKVIDHPEMYKDSFVKWCVENIESILTSFANEAINSEEGEPESDNKEEVKNEA